METKVVYHCWTEVEAYFDISTEAGKVIFDEIVDTHQRPNRYYHNLAHVRQILGLIDTQKVTKEQRIILILAAFYHDLVYVLASLINETLSCQKVIDTFESIGIVDPIVTQAAKIILDTNSHESEDELSQLFLDMDMSILGVDRPSYQIYLQQLEKEYSKIPKLLYRRGRKKFLENTLARPSIFFSPHFLDHYEKQAISNLQWELKTR
jgi:predicted metal-dependent HD superfamily phosphohydrolase